MGYVADIDDRQINSRSSNDLLYGSTSVAYRVGRTQHCVPCNNGSERAAKRIEIEYALQAKRRGFAKGANFSLQLNLKAHTLLHRR